MFHLILILEHLSNIRQMICFCKISFNFVNPFFRPIIIKHIIHRKYIFFISTYFCGAVYDGEAFAKAQMAVVSTLLIHELLMAQWKMNEKALSIKDVIEIVYRYSRELEHSDSNLNLIQELMSEREY